MLRHYASKKDCDAAQALFRPAPPDLTKNGRLVAFRWSGHGAGLALAAHKGTAHASPSAGGGIPVEAGELVAGFMPTPSSLGRTLPMNLTGNLEEMAWIRPAAITIEIRWQTGMQGNPADVVRLRCTEEGCVRVCRVLRATSQ